MGMNGSEAIELIAIPDTFATGVDRVEFLGRTNVRIYLYSQQDGQRVLSAKIVMAIESIDPSIMEVLKGLGTNRVVRPMWLDELKLADKTGRH